MNSRLLITFLKTKKYIISLDTSGIGVVMVRVLATNVATLVV